MSNYSIDEAFFKSQNDEAVCASTEGYAAAYGIPHEKVVNLVNGEMTAAAILEALKEKETGDASSRMRGDFFEKNVRPVIGNGAASGYDLTLAGAAWLNGLVLVRCIMSDAAETELKIAGAACSSSLIRALMSDASGTDDKILISIAFYGLGFWVDDPVLQNAA